MSQKRQHSHDDRSICVSVSALSSSKSAPIYGFRSTQFINVEKLSETGFCWENNRKWRTSRISARNFRDRDQSPRRTLFHCNFWNFWVEKIWAFLTGLNINGVILLEIKRVIYIFPSVSQPLCSRKLLRLT